MSLADSTLHNILPDSRAKEVRGRVFRGSQAWVPVFCANCGADGGMCPEENMTFLFYICRKCSETYGEIVGTMMMPDEVFFEKIKQEQLASHGRFLTPDEVEAEVQEGASPLAKLLLSGH